MNVTAVLSVPHNGAVIGLNGFCSEGGSPHLDPGQTTVVKPVMAPPLVSVRTVLRCDAVALYNGPPLTATAFLTVDPVELQLDFRPNLILAGTSAPIGSLAISPPLVRPVTVSFVANPAGLLSIQGPIELQPGSFATVSVAASSAVTQRADVTVAAAIFTATGFLFSADRTVTVLPSQPIKTVVESNAPFTVRPSPRPPGPKATLDFQVFCLDTRVNQVLPNCDVTIEAHALAGSGGHLHEDLGRPAGTFEPNGGNTGATGVLNVKYEAPQVAGEMVVTVAGSANGEHFLPVAFTIGVGIDGLVPMGVIGPGYEVDTASVGHEFNNQYVRADLVDNLQELPTEFAIRLLKGGIPLHEVPNLVYTAMSLPRGGLFDVDANEDGRVDNPWNPPHNSHRFGIEVDLRTRNVRPSMRNALRVSVRESGFSFPYNPESPAQPGASHWHLSVR